MQKLKDRILNQPFIKRLNTYKAMPIIWWSLLIMAMPYIFSLFRVPVVWRVGLLFLIINSLLSYHVGKLIRELKLANWWLLLLPALFCLAIMPRFASYNLIFGLIYLIFEAIGKMTRLYR